MPNDDRLTEAELVALFEPADAPATIKHLTDLRGKATRERVELESLKDITSHVIESGDPSLVHRALGAMRQVVAQRLL